MGKKLKKEKAWRWYHIVGVGILILVFLPCVKLCCGCCGGMCMLCCMGLFERMFGKKKSTRSSGPKTPEEEAAMFMQGLGFPSSMI